MVKAQQEKINALQERLEGEEMMGGQKLTKAQLEAQEGEFKVQNERVNYLEECLKAQQEKIKAQQEWSKAQQEELQAQLEAQQELKARQEELQAQLEAQQEQRNADRQELAEWQAEWEKKLDQNEHLTATIQELSKGLEDVQHLRAVCLRKFFEIARFKIHAFLAQEGCTECWMDSGVNYLGWNNMVSGLEHSPHWQGLLLEKGVSIDSLKLINYGAGTLQNHSSEVAHAGAKENTDVEMESLNRYAKAYARCIATQKPDHRSLLSCLFQFCFSCGYYKYV